MQTGSPSKKAKSKKSKSRLVEFISEAAVNDTDDAVVSDSKNEEKLETKASAASKIPKRSSAPVVEIAELVLEEEEDNKPQQNTGSRAVTLSEESKQVTSVDVPVAAESKEPSFEDILQVVKSEKISIVLKTVKPEILSRIIRNHAHEMGRERLNELLVILGEGQVNEVYNCIDWSDKNDASNDKLKAALIAGILDFDPNFTLQKGESLKKLIQRITALLLDKNLSASNQPICLSGNCLAELIARLGSTPGFTVREESFGDKKSFWILVKEAIKAKPTLWQKFADLSNDLLRENVGDVVGFLEEIMQQNPSWVIALPEDRLTVFIESIVRTASEPVSRITEMINHYEKLSALELDSDSESENDDDDERFEGDDHYSVDGTTIAGKAQDRIIKIVLLHPSFFTFKETDSAYQAKKKIDDLSQLIVLATEKQLIYVVGELIALKNYVKLKALSAAIIQQAHTGAIAISKLVAFAEKLLTLKPQTPQARLDGQSCKFYADLIMGLLANPETTQHLKEEKSDRQFGRLLDLNAELLSKASKEQKESKESNLNLEVLHCLKSISQQFLQHSEVPVGLIALQQQRFLNYVVNTLESAEPSVSSIALEYALVNVDKLTDKQQLFTNDFFRVLVLDGKACNHSALRSAILKSADKAALTSDYCKGLIQVLTVHDAQNLLVLIQKRMEEDNHEAKTLFLAMLVSEKFGPNLLSDTEFFKKQCEALKLTGDDLHIVYEAMLVSSSYIRKISRGESSADNMLAPEIVCEQLFSSFEGIESLERLFVNEKCKAAMQSHVENYFKDLSLVTSFLGRLNTWSEQQIATTLKLLTTQNIFTLKDLILVIVKNDYTKVAVELSLIWWENRIRVKSPLTVDETSQITTLMTLAFKSPLIEESSRLSLQERVLEYCGALKLPYEQFLEQPSFVVGIPEGCLQPLVNQVSRNNLIALLGNYAGKDDALSKAAKSRIVDCITTYLRNLDSLPKGDDQKEEEKTNLSAEVAVLIKCSIESSARPDSGRAQGIFDLLGSDARFQEPTVQTAVVRAIYKTPGWLAQAFNLEQVKKPELLGIRETAVQKSILSANNPQITDDEFKISFSVIHKSHGPTARKEFLTRFEQTLDQMETRAWLSPGKQKTLKMFRDGIAKSAKAEQTFWQNHRRKILMGCTVIGLVPLFFEGIVHLGKSAWEAYKPPQTPDNYFGVKEGDKEPPTSSKALSQLGLPIGQGAAGTALSVLVRNSPVSMGYSYDRSAEAKEAKRPSASPQRLPEESPSIPIAAPSYY